MATSEYLSTKTEGTVRNPLKASVYTGVAYLITVSFLVLPYLILKNYYLCLGCTMSAAVLIIALLIRRLARARSLSGGTMRETEPFRLQQSGPRQSQTARFDNGDRFHDGWAAPERPHAQPI